MSPGTIFLLVMMLISATSVFGAQFALSEKQFLIVNGASLRNVEVVVDCEEFLVQFGDVSIDLSPIWLREPQFPASHDSLRIQNSPFFNKALQNGFNKTQAMEEYRVRERELFRDIFECCVSHSSLRNVEVCLEAVQDMDSGEVIRDIIVDYEKSNVAVLFAGWGTYFDVAIDLKRGEKKYVDPCGYWKNLISSFKVFFEEPEDSRYRVVLVKDLSFGTAMFDSKSALLDYIGSRFPDMQLFCE